MEWDQDYTVKKYTETKTKNKQKQNQPEKWKINESFLLTRCWRHVLWADDVKLPLSAKGKWKIKHLSSFITGGGWGGRNEGGITWFSREQRREKQSLPTEYKGGGGGAIRHWLPVRGITKILQSFGGRGGYKINFSVIQWKSSHPLPRQYIWWLVPKVTKPAWMEVHKKINNWILALDNHRVALPVHFCQVNLEFIMLVFCQGRKTGAPRENLLKQGQEPTTN